MKRLRVVIEQTATGFGAWAPELPGCVAAAATRAETESLIREAVDLHLESMRGHNEEMPAGIAEGVVLEFSD
ncbi:MAG: type II toxin-antitoxin system HicB family antitoxin [Gemmatimonadales bacterium]